MSDFKQEVRSVISPGLATGLGVALGCVLAIISALIPRADFTFRFLMILLLSLGPCGGITGYLFWLIHDPARFDRFQKIISYAGFITIAVLLVFYPSFWWEIGRSLGPHMIFMFLARTFSAVALAVTAIWGMVHLVHHLASSSLFKAKPMAFSRKDGVWDHELDQVP